MSKHDEFSNFDSSDVDSWLQQQHAEEEQAEDEKKEGERLSPESDLPTSPDYDRIKEQLNAVFTECEKLGWSIQVAIATDIRDEHGDRIKAITLCGHTNMHNLPCEMVASATIYQSNHLFSHMVLAAAAAGAPLISLQGPDEDGSSS